MKLINNSLNIISCIVIMFIVSSCANLKVIEHSASQKPSWIYGIEKNYLIGEGTGSNYNEAKYNALQMVKEKIVSSVAQSISFEQNIKVNETRYKKAIEFLEEYTSKTTSKTGNRSYLQGISLSKVTDYYWEKQRVNRVEKVFYYIKYPFTDSDIQLLIKEWEEQEEQLSLRLDTLKFSKNRHKTIESIIAEIEELQYLSGFFVDQRKTTADISIKNLENKLNAIQIVPEVDSLGFYKYFLMLGEDSIKTMQKPKLSSNCAKIQEINASNQYACIKYEYDECFVEDDNFLDISYLFEEWNLNHIASFDVSLKKISIENKNDISFSSVNKGVFKKDHTIKCHFTIRSKSPVPFTIDKIELVPQLCKRNCAQDYNYRNYPLIIIENVNKHFSGKGNHSFEVQVSIPKSQSKQWASRNGLSTKISGKIHYSSTESNESKIHEFSDLEYYTNW
ncbi:MAG: hypothetical protein KOO66_05755 [Bacteroidales bacterium]|nr:hypothetical protein [Bacteroidales bacterium]